MAMTSIIFTDDEARYVRALMKHLDKPPDNNRASWIFNGLHIPEKKINPVGEFRILVIGARGVGKTSFLKKVRAGNNSNAVDASSGLTPEDCQHIITLESDDYKIDALELPFTDITSPEAMEQLSNAIAMTDAAVLVYDVVDISSLTYLKSLSKIFYNTLHHTEAMATKKKTSFPFTMSYSRVTTTTLSVPNRPYDFLLLGTKNDVPAAARDVSWIEGYKAAGEFFGPDGVSGGASVHFMEVSSRTGDNIGSVFPLLGREILRGRREHQREQRRLREREMERYGDGTGNGERQQRQNQQRPRGGGVVGIGACDGWGCSGFDFYDDDDDADDDDDDDCDYQRLVEDDDANADHEGLAGGGRSGAVSGSMRRRWGALKATLSGTLSKKDIK